VFGRTGTRTRVVGEQAVKLRGQRCERKDWDALIMDHHAP